MAKALLIGINSPVAKNADVGDVKFAQNDCELMRQALVPLGIVASIVLDPENERSVCDKLEELIKQLKPDEPFLFYFAGHAYFEGNYWLGPSSRALNAVIISQILFGNPAGALPRGRIVILDCCKSEKFPMPTKGGVRLSAADEYSQAFESDAFQAGVYTRFLANALTSLTDPKVPLPAFLNDEGTIDWIRLAETVASQVSTWSKECGLPQGPPAAHHIKEKIPFPVEQDFLKRYFYNNYLRPAADDKAAQIRAVPPLTLNPHCWKNISLHPPLERFLQRVGPEQQKIPLSKLEGELTQARYEGKVIQIHGATGSGKSTVLQALFLNLVNKDCPAILLEVPKTPPEALTERNIIGTIATLLREEVFPSVDVQCKTFSDPPVGRFSLFAKHSSIVVLLEGLSQASYAAVCTLVSEALRHWTKVTLVVSSGTAAPIPPGSELIEGKSISFVLNDLLFPDIERVLQAQVHADHRNNIAQWLTCIHDTKRQVIRFPVTCLLYISFLAAEINSDNWKIRIRDITLAVLAMLLEGAHRRHGPNLSHELANACLDQMSHCALTALGRQSRCIRATDLGSVSDCSRACNGEPLPYLERHTGLIIGQANQQYRFPDEELLLVMASHAMQLRWSQASGTVSDTELIKLLCDVISRRVRAVPRVFRLAAQGNTQMAVEQLSFFSSRAALRLLAWALEHGEQVEDPNRLIRECILKLDQNRGGKACEYKLHAWVDVLSKLSGSNEIFGEPKYQLIRRMLNRFHNCAPKRPRNRQSLPTFMRIPGSQLLISPCITNAQFYGLVGFFDDGHDASPVIEAGEAKRGTWWDAMAYTFALADYSEKHSSARLPNAQDIGVAHELLRSDFSPGRNLALPEGADAEWCAASKESLPDELEAIWGNLAGHPIEKTAFGQGNLSTTPYAHSRNVDIAEGLPFRIVVTNDARRIGEAT